MITIASDYAQNHQKYYIALAKVLQKVRKERELKLNVKNRYMNLKRYYYTSNDIRFHLIRKSTTMETENGGK